MAELSTIARPYARAAFEYARDNSVLAAWSEQLLMAAAVTRDATMRQVLNNPAETAEQLATSLIDVCGDSLDDNGRSFVNILASNKRLTLLPQISVMFEQYKANQERTVEVQVYSAFEVSEETEQTLVQVLKNKLERDVKVDTTVDEKLLGGVLIRAGDLVIDGSVRGRLNKLAEAMNS
ncbi:F0F1 ATP synthase subunit delta [Halieaceae bacterium IMCC14734]|uniref:ATP synthase subunit delta n=1 Tax=Candidatus Litorirhabdus singularis TaxID=2518993 RepID=A0ABT3TCI7_9GAMM|nr:F0F1 ATP synthase subunit delta [Candidatus Litorirhabdus singularis]MCX2979983.1 F0F1 ATP synthase subunit delta [Candidatus Litorirhabdus singularis]